MLLSKVHLGAAPLTAQESFEARKNRLQKALLMATLLEKEEHDDHSKKEGHDLFTTHPELEDYYLKAKRETNY